MNQICAEFNAKEDALPEPESATELAEQAGTVRRDFRSAIDKIRALGEPPEDIAADVNLFLDTAERIYGVIDDIVEAAEQNQVDRIQELAQEGDELTEESDLIAAQIGADSCDQD